uniref:E3 SUMO-protein ligase NSE2 n=1 Tax=Panagrellus redivivus TaxID=6233 RepID=A0A7E4VI75_PANRE
MDVRHQFTDEGELGLGQIMTLLNNLSKGLGKTPIDNEQVRAATIRELDALRQRARYFSALTLMQRNFDKTIANASDEEIEALDFGKLFNETIEKELTENDVHQAYWNKFDHVRQAMLYNPQNPDTAPPPVEGVQRNNSEEEDDIIVEEEEIRMLDPITKQRIITPVKNTVCNHVYDRTAVLKYIEENRINHMLCQCPQPGCGNKKQLSERDIVDFPEYFERAAM